ncbi:MAG: glycosyltransferase family 2 protein [Lachnospiraceae bacterium]
MTNDIMVSVVCLAYNHSKYIRKCLEGFVMQKTNFRYEVIIHDDCSTDDTADIIREFSDKYDFIVPIFQEKNMYSQKISITNTFIKPLAYGKYIAVCEGDDCWIDDNKLQKQVDFLERNPDFSTCYHRVVYNDLKTRTKTVIPNIDGDREYSVSEIIEGGALFQLSSYMTRKEYYFDMPECFRANGFGDIQRYIYGAINGRVMVLQDIMSQYNHGTDGSWTSQRDTISNKKKVLHQQDYKRMLVSVNEYYDNAFEASIKRMIEKLDFSILVLQGDFNSARRYSTLWNEYRKTRVTSYMKKRFPMIYRIIKREKYYE